MSYSKQTWTNNVSSIDEDKMNHIEDGIEENSIEIEGLKVRNIITAGGTESITATETGEVKIPITNVVRKVGDKFTISNNRIYVGAEISEVLVSAQVYFNLSTNRGAALNTYIRKNGTNIGGLTNGGDYLKTGGNQTLATAPTLISCNEGDYFELYISSKHLAS